jgi:hypothetical protein
VYGTADIRPHDCNPDADGFDQGAPTATPPRPASREYCPDHYKPIPVQLPAPSDTQYAESGLGTSGMWGGTPYLGVPGDMPPVNPGAETQLNLVGGIAFMWHSHAERELTTNNIFIGGMATMALIVPVSVPTP